MPNAPPAADVNDDPVTPDANVVPVNVPAGAITDAVLCAVTSPFAFVVNTGIAVDDPTDPEPLLTVANVVALPALVTSPVRFAFVVTVAAFPPIFNAVAVPVKFVATPLDGVPNAGVTSVGLFDKTTFPVPVGVFSPSTPALLYSKLPEVPPVIVVVPGAIDDATPPDELITPFEIVMVVPSGLTHPCTAVVAVVHADPP